jgi:hypothetical protein
MGKLFASTNLSFLWGLVPFFFTCFVIAPYFVWKTTQGHLQKAQRQLQELITPRLGVEVESDPEKETLPDGEVKYWWHLIVHNPTGTKISGCYCKLVSCRSQTKLNVAMPKRGMRYPWSTRGGSSLSRATCTIGSNSFDVVDIAICQSDEPNSFYTPILARDQYRSFPQFPLPPGTYRLDIEIGSDDLDFQPTLRTIEFQFHGGFDLRIKDITE